MKQKQISSCAVASVVVALATQAFAVSGTWTGGATLPASPTDFTVGANWSTGSVPGGGDTGTFSAANNGTTISLPAALGTIGTVGGVANVVSVSAPTIAFDATAAAYTIGTATNGSNYYGGTSGQGLFQTTAGSAAQTINAKIVLGNRSGTPAVVTQNNSAFAETFNGDIQSMIDPAVNPGAFWQLQSQGSGDKIYNGVLSDGGSGGLKFYARVGLNVLNGPNAYSSGTRFDAAVRLGNKSGFGTGVVTMQFSSATLSAGTDLSGANAIANNFVNNNAGGTTFNVTGTNNLQINGGYDLNNTATAGTTNFNVSNTGTTTLSGVVSNSGALTVLDKLGSGVLILSNTANTYSGNTYVDGGTLLINGNTGTSGFIRALNSGSVLGGSGTTAGIIQINTGTSLRPGPAVGNSTGVMTTTSTGPSALVLTTGSTSVFDINGTARGTQYDGFTAAGRVNYGGDLTINLNAITGGTNVYDLFAFSSLGATTFNSITITGADAGALAATGGGNFSGTFNGGQDTISFSQATGDLTVTAVVPEPAALGAVLGAAALVVRRRRAAR